MNMYNDRSELITRFDYEALDLQQRSIVEQRTREIRERLQHSAQAIWEIGQKLADVRSQLKYGQFEAWLKAEFDWSRRTAYNFINVYEAFNERANLAQIDIATSALYLLAAPSTSQEIRAEFLQRAKEGETITHKKLSQVIKEGKLKASGGIEQLEQSESKDVSIETTKQQIITIIPKEIVEGQKSQAKVSSVDRVSVASVGVSLDNIQSGWHLLDGQHLLFCGDTASREFIEYIPLSALAIAISSEDWDHDWLVERAKRIIIFPESDFEPQKFEQLIEMFSILGDIIVFPWLPRAEMLAIAHKLRRKIIAGEANLDLCRQAIAHSGLTVEKLINSPKVS